MIYNKKIWAVLVSCIICASCNKSDEPEMPIIDEPENVSFTASMKTVSRATETEFEEKDEIVVYAVQEDEYKNTALKSSGNYADHVRYTYAGGKFTNAKGIIRPTDFGVRYFAVYPYSAVTGVPTFKFNVKTNQNVAGQYTFSDLCTAVSNVTSAKDVNLVFSHRLSHVIVNLDGESLGTDNVEVRLNDVHTGCDVNLNNNTFVAYESKSTVYCADNGTNSHKAIIAPQTIKKDSPFLTAVLNGKEYVLKATSDIQFTSGKQQVFNLTVKNDEIVSYTSSILPWDTAENEKEQESGIYSLEDLIAFRDARNAGEDVSMWKNENGEINLYADIDLSEIEWNPIEELFENEVFDGNKHTIRLKKTKTEPNERWGLIIRNDGEIKNLLIEACLQMEERFVSADGIGSKVQSIGVVCHHNSNKGKVVSTEVSLYGDSRLKYFTFGGIVDTNYGTVESCSVEGHIVLESSGGGICDNNNGVIRMCTNRLFMQKNSAMSDIGGIAGGNGKTGEIHDCVNEADLHFAAGSGLGGIVGGMWGGKVESCINKGNIVGHDGATYHCKNVGGIVGRASGTGYVYDAEDTPTQEKRIILNCTNLGKISGEEGRTGGIVGSLAGIESIMEGCSYGGTVNGATGSEANAIGTDLR